MNNSDWGALLGSHTPIVNPARLDDYSHNAAKSCVWTYHPGYSEFSEDYWDTECGQAYCMIEGTPKDNGYNYCPHCGKPLQEFVMLVEEEE